MTLQNKTNLQASQASSHQEDSQRPPQIAIEFAPQKVRRHGLRDAHSWPLPHSDGLDSQIESLGLAYAEAHEISKEQGIMAVLETEAGSKLYVESCAISQCSGKCSAPEKTTVKAAQVDRVLMFQVRAALVQKLTPRLNAAFDEIDGELVPGLGSYAKLS